MTVKEVINDRRSIRKFHRNETIPNYIITDLIDCARNAPSAKNRQPWKFLVIANYNDKKKFQK